MGPHWACKALKAVWGDVVRKALPLDALPLLVRDPSWGANYLELVMTQHGACADEMVSAVVHCDQEEVDIADGFVQHATGIPHEQVRYVGMNICYKCIVCSRTVRLMKLDIAPVNCSIE